MISEHEPTQLCPKNVVSSEVNAVYGVLIKK